MFHYQLSSLRAATIYAFHIAPSVSAGTGFRRKRPRADAWVIRPPVKMPLEIVYNLPHKLAEFLDI